MIFDAEKLSEIHRQAVGAGLHAKEKRSLLYFSVTVDYVARLPDQGNPSDQLLSDLQNMSTDGWVGDMFPLTIWLRNAASQTHLFPERTTFFSQRAEEAAQTPRPRSFFGRPRPEPGAPSPAILSSLDAAHKDGLVAAIEACLTIEDLQSALQKCFGDVPNLYGVDQAAPAVRDLARQSIELVEREKLTVVFLHFAVTSLRSSDQLRQEAITVFPELQVALQPFSATVDAAATYLGTHAASVAALLGGGLAKQFNLSVRELKCYKGLHEAIHQFKNNPPPRVPDDDGKPDWANRVRQFRQELRQYLAALNTAHGRLQEAIDELPAESTVRAAQKPSITLVGGCARRIEGALTSGDIDSAATALESTADTVDPMLVELNQHIVETAQQILDGPLDRLRGALADSASGAMSALRLALRLRVLAHTRWQEVENSLSSLGGVFQSDTRSAFKTFTRRWKVARKQIPILTDSDSIIDTAPLEVLARKVDSALLDLEKSVSTAGDDKEAFESVMFEPFDEFRFQTQQRFLRIDTALKRNCADLVRVVATA